MDFSARAGTTVDRREHRIPPARARIVAPKVTGARGGLPENRARRRSFGYAARRARRSSRRASRPGHRFAGPVRQTWSRSGKESTTMSKHDVAHLESAAKKRRHHPAAPNGDAFFEELIPIGGGRGGTTPAELLLVEGAINAMIGAAGQLAEMQQALLRGSQ